MYDWRTMTEAERQEALTARQAARRPWHRLPHEDWGGGAYHISAACFEHARFIGRSASRMADFEHQLLLTLAEKCQEVHAWCVLPNHYHALAETNEIKALLSALGRRHGRTSYTWNGQEGTRGRKVWFGACDRSMRSDGHFWATMNYIHHNPVKHGYVTRWEDWPYTSARDYLESVGREEAERIWKTYPVLDYGKGWDEPDM